MAVRTLDQINAELDSIYSPYVNLYRKKQSAIPTEIRNEEKALKAQEADYYDNTIMTDARRRGIAFGGIPIAERARYGATQFLPSLARLRQSGKDKAMSLEEAILGLNERRSGQALTLRQQDTDNDYRERVFQAQQQEAERARAAAANANAGIASMFGGGGANIPAQPDEKELMKASLSNFLKRNYQAIPNATRAQQDNWVRSWATQFGINPNLPNDPDGIWSFYNQLYPYEQYNRQPVGSGVRKLNTSLPALRQTTNLLRPFGV